MKRSRLALLLAALASLLAIAAVGAAVLQPEWSPEETQRIGSPGSFSWGGAASTIFWVDPVEDLTCVFMTQLLPSGTFDFRGQLASIIYPSIID